MFFVKIGVSAYPTLWIPEDLEFCHYCKSPLFTSNYSALELYYLQVDKYGESEDKSICQIVKDLHLENNTLLDNKKKSCKTYRRR